MSDFQKALKNTVRGELRFDPLSKRIYSVDASIYEIEPVGVFLPHDTEDVQAAVSLAKDFQIPIIARGAATGITGGCIGKGLIIDFSKFLHQIEEIDYESGYAICQTGVVQDVLNAALLNQGMRLGPDTSTGNRATLGGMIANNAAGSYSLRYGMMVDHLIEAEIVLADGSLISLGEEQAHHWETHLQKKSQEGTIYRAADQVRSEYKKEIEDQYQPLPRRASGYRLDTLLQNSPPNLAKILCGSEGTLGMITKAKVKICQAPQHQVMLLCFFDSLQAALACVPQILFHSPLSVELVDQMILDQAKKHPDAKNQLEWLEGNPAAVLVIEFDGLSSDMSQKAALNCQKELSCKSTFLTSKELMSAVWKVRKSGLELLQSKRSYRRAVAFIEDLSVPPEHLPQFMEELLPLLQESTQVAGIYGHVGAGCIHIRPYIDMRNVQEVKAMKQLAEQSAMLIKRYHGAMSGEHGDGLVRSWANASILGPQIIQAHQIIKDAFDPDNLMNPGKILTAAKQIPLENLRLSPKTEHLTVSTFLDFSKEGGFALAVDLCNGNGLCRKKEGIMCPSFQATNDEYDTTRARAQTLKTVIEKGGGHLTDSALQEVLDLCLECKGCKRECPSQVDMAKMKAESLYQMQEKQGYSWRNKLFGYTPWINRLLSKAPTLSNQINRSKPIKWLLAKTGITPKRTLPILSTPLHKQLPIFKQYEDRVVLFSDTYSTHHCPDVALSAIDIIQDLKFTPLIPPWKCCGRTYFSKGMLKQAKRQAQTVVNLLYPYAEQGLNIIILEPSCHSMLFDDYRGLLGEDPKWLSVQKKFLLFEEWLLLQQEHFPKIFKEQEADITIHSHCHQKALKGEGSAKKLLTLFPNIRYQILETGCCGMAGSFGYESEHYELSMKIGSLSLFPALSQTENKICSNGFSCRHQIEDGTGKIALHLAQILCSKKGL